MFKKENTRIICRITTKNILHSSIIFSKKRFNYVLALIFGIILISSNTIASLDYNGNKAYASHQFLWWNDAESFASFGTGSQIIIDTGALDFIDECETGGVEDYIWPWANIYVVPTGSVSLGDPINDISGHEHAVMGSGQGGIFGNELIGVAKAAGLYDVIYDECQNEILDQEDKVFTKAFEVTTSVLPLPSLQNMKIAASQETKKWAQTLYGFEALNTLYDIYKYSSRLAKCIGSIVGCFTDGGHLLDAFKLYMEKLTGVDPKRVAKIQLLNTIKHYAAIAQDPPDPNYRQITLLSNETTHIDPIDNDPIEQNIVDLGNNANAEDVLLEGLLQSLERYQGAQAESNIEWALIHARAIKSYANSLSGQMELTKNSLLSLSNVVVTDSRDLDGLAINMEQLNARIQSSGFTSVEVQQLLNLGLSGAQINDLGGYIANLNVSGFSKEKMQSDISELIDTYNYAIPVVDDFVQEMDVIISDIGERSIVRIPLANAGGPYNINEGLPLTLNGSASSDNDGRIMSWDWDLNGDGLFNDASGVSPSVTFTHEFNGMIGLGVTDNEGNKDVEYTHLVVSDINRPPNIVSFGPKILPSNVVLNSTLQFNVTAVDPNGDSVTEKWYVDGSFISTGSTFTYRADDLGFKLISANVSDNTPLGGTVIQDWPFIVVLPDIDNDSWNTNVDCDDNDSAINPGAKEIRYNGIDDDCNLSTLDNNTAPVANNQTVAGFQNSENTLSLSASDVDGDQLTFSIVDPPVNGTLSNITHYSGTPDVATVIYTPTPNFHGTDKFTFKVNDGKEDSNKTGTLNIGTVISESPTAHEQHLSTKENTPIEIELTATNPDGHSLQFSIAGVTKIGGVTGHSVYGMLSNLTQTGPNTAKVTYIPGPNYVSEKWFGDDYFTFKVKDGQDIPGFEGRAESSAFVYITVNDTNNAPVVYNKTVSTFENTPVNITLRGQDADNDLLSADTPYNHGLNFSVVSLPLHGNVSEVYAEVQNIKTPHNDTDHRIVYTPETGYVGSDLFTIKANDDELDSNVATISITVKPSNQNISKEFENGDVILGTALRGTQWFKPDGTLVKILPASPNSMQTAGGAFDSQGNLYMSEFGTLALYNGDGVSIYNSTGEYVGGLGNNKREDYGCLDDPTQPHIGFDCMIPESVIMDKNGSIYVGGIATSGGETLPEDDARDDIRKFDSEGNLLATFNVRTEARGADWIELGPDQCTLYYTSEDIHVKRYNVCTDTQLPDFANVYGAGRPTHELGGATALPSYALRLLPDGGMLVASQSKIVRLDLSGSIIQLYDAPGEHVWFSLNLDPDGKSFWSASSGASGSPYVYRFEIETGKVLQYIKSNGGNGVSGVVIKGELIEATKEYPPEVFDANVTTNRNTPVIVNLTGSDIANDNLTFSIVNGPANGQVEGLGIQPLTKNISQIEYTPNTNFTGVDSFTFKANDGTMDSNNTGVVNITVNSEPLARNDIANTIEGKSVNIPVLANDTSETANPINTNDILTIQSLNTSRLIGDAVINTNNNTVSYIPLLTFTGTESFEYIVSDGNGATDSATVTVNIRSLNEVPIANVQSISTPEDTPLNFTLTGTDPNGDPISFSSFTGPSNGFLRILNSTTGLTEYTPLRSYHGNDTYQFRVSDGKLFSSPANISITIVDDGINDPPIATSERVSTPFNQELSIDVLANDIDPNNDTLSIADVIFGPVYSGNTTINNNNDTITFKPATNFIGSDVFFYNVTDGNGGLDTAQVIVDVTPPGTNNAPTAFNHTAKVKVNTPTNITLTGSDPDQNPLRFFVVADPFEGNITSTVNPINDTAASVEYTPAADFNGADSFNYIAFDGALQSNLASVLVNVTNTTDTQPPINNPPIASDDAVIANEDNQVNIDVLANDTDNDVDDTISVIDIADSLQPENGTAVINANNGTITYTPFANYNGEDRFDYIISDNTANSTAIVSVTINPVNDAPVAASSINVTTSEDSPVDIILSGTDIDNDTLAFSTLSRPTSGNLSSITTINNTTANVTYTPSPQFFGSDGFTFNVNDGIVNSTNDGSVSIAVEHVNHPPVANAGTDFELSENTTGTLNGTASSDPDAAVAGDTIASYDWMQAEGPPVTLQEANTATPSFTAPPVDEDTLLRFNLTVTDNNGLASINPASVNVTVRNVNQPLPLSPIATITPTNQTVDENTTGVTLSGVSSYDPDGGDIVSYLWEQIAGPTITLNSTTSPSVQFDAPPSVTEDTLLQFNLTVTDNEGALSDNSNNSTATVLVRNINQLPIANAGPDQTADENSTTNIVLDGSASTDPDGDLISSYSWEQIAGPTVNLNSTNTAVTSFAAPSVSQDTVLTFNLTVEDTAGDFSSDTVDVTIRNVNQLLPPIANAGPDQTVNENSTGVTLNGTGSTDPDGNVIASYNWVQIAGSPTVSLSGADTATPSFTAPSVNTDTSLAFTLTVTDNEGLSSTNNATTTVLVKNINNPPTANAGIDQTVNENTTNVRLDGSGSSDIDGTITSYNWRQTQGPTVSLQEADTATPTFTAPIVTTDTTLTFSLTVTDNDGLNSTEADTVNILVKNVNQAPIAKATVSPATTVEKDTLVTLDGSSSTDPDGNTIASYKWEQISPASPTITLSGANTAKATFTAPSVTADTTFTFKLTVTDSNGSPASTTVNVLVKKPIATGNQPPIAKAVVLPSSSVAKGTLVTLDGSTSTDPDPGDSIASFKWEQTAGSPTINLNGANTAKATFTAPSVTADTTFTFKLTVTDKQSVSSSTSVNVIVQKDTQLPPSNQPPDTSKATPSTGTLWPPNHKMVKITIQNVIDPDGNGECHNTASNSFEDISKSKSSNNKYDNNMGKSSSNIKQNIKQSCDIEGDSITIKITRIMQDEPVNGLGDGDASPDATGIGTDTAYLRAERAGNGDGRVYHIYFTATDSEGLSSNGEVIVSVPHDQSGRKAIDSGPKYDSTMKSSTADITPPAIVGTTP